MWTGVIFVFNFKHFFGKSKAVIILDWYLVPLYWPGTIDWQSLAVHCIDCDTTLVISLDVIWQKVKSNRNKRSMDLSLCLMRAVDMAIETLTSEILKRALNEPILTSPKPIWRRSYVYILHNPTSPKVSVRFAMCCSWDASHLRISHRLPCSIFKV